MICRVCEPWCARTIGQLENRRKMQRQHPDISVHKCPSCGSDEWVDTDAYVVAEPRRARRVLTPLIVSWMLIAASIIVVVAIMLHQLWW